MKEMDVFDEIEKTFKTLYFGWDGVEQFTGSGDRLRRLVAEMCWPMARIDEESNKCLKAVYPDPYDEMLVTKPINVWTFCPHHLLPCNFKVHIGYIPSGKVLGLSKFARVAVIYGKSPIMQEQYNRDLANFFWENLKPEGLGVFVTGKHGCMGCRGVNQELEVITSVLKGSFKTDGIVREEFYHLCRG